MLYIKLLIILCLATLASCMQPLGEARSVYECNKTRQTSQLRDFCDDYKCMGMSRAEVYAKIGHPDIIYEGIGRIDKKKIVVEEYNVLTTRIWRRNATEKIFGKEEIVTRESIEPYCNSLSLSYYPDEDIVIGIRANW